jgi:thiol-disulfide isomerase/thioredoxin
MHGEAMEVNQDSRWYGTDANGRVNIRMYFFWSQGCPHCRQAVPFIDELRKRYAWLDVDSREISTRENAISYILLARQLGRDAQSVPAFLFCGQMYEGYDSRAAMGAFIEQQLRRCHDALKRSSVPAFTSRQLGPLSLPLLGTVDPTSMSLPAFTVVIAGMDAFNPCAFFVLLFLLSLLVHAKSRGRILLIGGIFVLFSGLVYFAFMAAWLNAFLLLGEIKALTAIAGVLAIAIALVNIKDFFWFGSGPSLSIPEGAKPRLFERMRAIAAGRNLFAMIVGTSLLAVAANSYELLCTAGFPMVYTRILTLNDLPSISYYLYLAFYNFIYIIPLAVIVSLFALTLGSRKLTERQGRMLKLLSGLMMFELGLVLVFAPAMLSRVDIAFALLVFALAIASAISIGERVLLRRTQQ